MRFDDAWPNRVEEQIEIEGGGRDCVAAPKVLLLAGRRRILGNAIGVPII